MGETDGPARDGEPAGGHCADRKPIKFGRRRIQRMPKSTNIGSPIRKLAAHAEQFPQRADTHYHLAVCQTVRHQRGIATEVLNRSLSINPKYTAARRLHEHLAH